MGEIVDVRSGKDYKHVAEGDIPVYGTGVYDEEETLKRLLPQNLKDGKL
ncbi:MAG: hypothetical protein NC428_09150 [Clostridium sp.]|nr:hypothetical protein [Clostridium sp.]